MKFHWITLWILGIIIGCGHAQFSDNTPPVVVVERYWTVPDTEPVGAVIVRVHAEDNEGDPLEYGLEKPDGPSNFNIFMNNSLRDLPFRIDNQTGVVYTNDSLADRGGESLFLYVTVYDGQLTHKSEVWVDIMNTTGLQDSRRPAPPRIPSNMGPGFRAPPPPNPNFRTPFHPMLFPGRPFPKPINNVQLPSQPATTKVSSTTTTTTSTTTTTESTTKAANLTTTTVKPTKVTEDTSATNKVVVTSAPVDESQAVIRNLALTIIPLVLVCATFLVSAISVCVFRKKMCKTKKKSKKGDKDKEMAANNTSLEEPMAMQQWLGPRAYSNRYEAWDSETAQHGGAMTAAQPLPEKLDPWEFPRHHLKVFNILGEGCFGQVWKCEAMSIAGREGPSVVAVKTLKENAGERERTDLLQELQVMKMLEPHANVVRLLGCCTEKDPLFVIMEYICHGKLQSYLRNSRAQRYYDNMHAKSATLTSRDLTSFCYQVARGMEFLSGKGIIHRDLAARNILVGENQICKVADFGFARDVITSHVYERKSEGRLPIRWMAPESLYDNLFSVKSDIWSFGVLIWEIVTLGSTPYPGLGAAEVMRKVRDGYRLDKPEHCRRELYNIMYYCWDQDPAERPTFTELVTLLEQLLLTETDYIQLDRFPGHSYYNMVSLSGKKL
ncbi:tyrosine kinase receptor Cad96Ca isoform X1 [Macrosteles quadrilineatus]|uniref:tyrosine kinase receptor Cad96Ca isoform X1 n=1 Tax=Macrosteles quadrilineatus TaxID=74068 RepID=UPI0023E0A139|nr:tyrosine kinase receptor Cad96Ca isoform X1 [Macrosteles quadrilineatus]